MVKMYRLGLLIFAVGQSLFLGCEKRNKGSESLLKDSVQVIVSSNGGKQLADIGSQKKITLDSNEVKLDSFEEIPKEIIGCSCFFSDSKKSFENGQFIFVAGYDSVAFISIDYQIIKLKLVSTGRDPHSFGDYDHVDVYKSDHLTVTVDVKYIEGQKLEEEGESWLDDGMITVENKSGKKETMKFYGSCGC